MNISKRIVSKDDSLISCVTAMTSSNLPSAFILDAAALARRDNAILGLMLLWLSSDEEDRAEIEADLQNHIEDERELPQAAHGPVEKPKIGYRQLGEVAGDVAAFKAKLRDHIDQAGGVAKVASLTGMPQPSLSRLLNSGSMPRRTTLYKIAKAIGLSESEIAFEWTK